MSDRGPHCDLSTLALVLLAVVPASAGTIIWGNHANYSGYGTIEAYDLDTGAVVQQFSVPNPTARSGNGRGIVVVGNAIYYTIAESGKIFATNSITHSDDGVLFDTGLNGIAALSWDGASLWLIGYNDSPNAFRYDLAGNLLQTVLGFGNDRDGFEVVGGHIVTNNGDGRGPYDLYDLNGNLIQSEFISIGLPADLKSGTGVAPTGVAFDGTYYIVAGIAPSGPIADRNRLYLFDSSGAFVKTVHLGLPYPDLGGGPYATCIRCLEDISAVPTPEPSCGFIIAAVLAVAARPLSNKRRKAREAAHG